MCNAVCFQEDKAVRFVMLLSSGGGFILRLWLSVDELSL